MKPCALQRRTSEVVSPLDIDAHIYEHKHCPEEAGGADEVQRSLTAVER